MCEREARCEALEGRSRADIVGAPQSRAHAAGRNGAPVPRTSDPTAAAALLEEHGVVVIDLSHVQYMDSSGVATLVECLQRTRNAGIELHLCQLNERVLSVFQIARLDGVFSIVGTIDDAMTA